MATSSAGKVKSLVLTNEIVLRTEVPWASFQSAGVISREQLDMIYSLLSQPVPSQVATFHLKGTALVSCFIDVLT